VVRLIVASTWSNPPYQRTFLNPQNSHRLSCCISNFFRTTLVLLLLRLLSRAPCEIHTDPFSGIIPLYFLIAPIPRIVQPTTALWLCLSLGVASYSRIYTSSYLPPCLHFSIFFSPPSSLTSQLLPMVFRASCRHHARLSVLLN